jgi:hypothetical protein
MPCWRDGAACEQGRALARNPQLENSMNLTQGTARAPIAGDQVARLRAAGVLIEDSRRERPRYFDGRFLAARDLIRDQQYFLTREADLGQASGSGVATGLFVQEGSQPHTLSVDAGHGVTPAGELVMLPRAIDVQLANIPVAEQLSARFGLSRMPQPPMRSRTGLFVLALRPVEFTANPIGAYPTAITGQRTVEDGDVIEATAVVLVPWQDDGAGDALDARRGRVARDVFVASVASGLSANVLPLAMVALQNNTIVWIDEAMVRRDLGADRGDLPGLGFAPRALRLAHLMQYQAHLQYVLDQSNGRPFPASAHFPALPSVGPLPPGVINPLDFTQNFFPAEIDVDFSIVPEDELPALVEEALALQPIDLSVGAESLDSTAVLVLAPVPRHQWRAVVARLESVTRLIKPAAPNLLAQQKPFELLQKLRVPRPALGSLNPGNPSDAEWQRLAKLSTLWFVRRRHLSVRDDFTGAWKSVTGVDERQTELVLISRLETLGLSANFDRLIRAATPSAASTLTNLLASKRFSGSPTLTAAAIGSMVSASNQEAVGGKTLDRATVLKIAADLNAPGTGEGLIKIEQAVGSDRVSSVTLQKLASGDAWKKIDSDAIKASPTGLVKIATTAIQLKPIGGVPTPVPPAPPAPTPAPVPTPPVVRPPVVTPPPVVVSPTRPPVTPPVVVPPVAPVPPVVRPPVVVQPPVVVTPVRPPVRPPVVVAPVVPVVRPPVVVTPVRPPVLTPRAATAKKTSKPAKPAAVKKPVAKRAPAKKAPRADKKP